MDSPHLFSPLSLRGITIKNRIVVSPMCQYSSVNGFANDWHLVHLGSRAIGGAGLIFTEAAAVTPEGRISPHDLGIWSDEHIVALAHINQFIENQGSLFGIQLAHAGRKASTKTPWEGGGNVSHDSGGWQPVAPSALPFSKESLVPRELNTSEISEIIASFARAALRAYEAGLKVIEIHAAHGYLIHEFLSPLSNHRTDNYGGSFENRIRLLLEIVDAIQAVWIETYPIFVRISATDWVNDGWTIEDSVKLSKRLKEKGVDVIDVSSGGNVRDAKIPAGPGYQTGFAERIRREANILSGAIGFITAPAQADHIIRSGQGDLIFIAREFLRDPYWPLHAAKELGFNIAWPQQYLRAAPPGSPSR